MRLSGGDRKVLTKELSKSHAATKIFAERSAEKRREGGAPATLRQLEPRPRHGPQ
jgi:hypothetical protein